MIVLLLIAIASPLLPFFANIISITIHCFLMIVGLVKVLLF